MMGDAAAIYEFLAEYPDAISMTKITIPHVYTYVGQEPEDVGISGFVLIAESHISIHTFPRRNYLNIDVFSCKDFDAEKAIGELSARFSLRTIRSWKLQRGLEYSKPETWGGVTYPKDNFILQDHVENFDNLAPATLRSSYKTVDAGDQD
jgi:S-adenosylmethionine decarboxylase